MRGRFIWNFPTLMKLKYITSHWFLHQVGSDTTPLKSLKKCGVRCHKVKDKLSLFCNVLSITAYELKMIRDIRVKWGVKTKLLTGLLNLHDQRWRHSFKVSDVKLSHNLEIYILTDVFFMIRATSKALVRQINRKSLTWQIWLHYVAVWLAKLRCVCLH